MRKGLTIGTVMALAVTPAVMQAQSDHLWTNECVSNGLVQACSSFQVYTTWNETTELNDVAIWVQNRDVDMGYQQLLVSLGLVTPTLEGVDYSSSNITLEGDAFINPTGSKSDSDVLSEWGLTTYQQPGGGTTLEFGVTGTSKDDGTGDTNSAIVGCYQSSTIFTGSIGTCDNMAGDGSGSNTGWVVFNFTTTNKWYASDAELSYRYKSVRPSNGDYSLTCPDGGVDCTTEVVPEPATMALLATGLLGLGFVAMRRREGEDVI